ncbi:hypothetical protein GPU89_28340 [Burkholderia cepacia]|nr:hypothetical protein [Burkholderia cepacia]
MQSENATDENPWRFLCAAGSCETTTVGVTMTASDAADADHGRYASRRDHPINQAACTASQAATLSARGTPRNPAPPAKTPRHAVAFSVTASRRRPARRDQ